MIEKLSINLKIKIIIKWVLVKRCFVERCLAFWTQLKTQS